LLSLLAAATFALHLRTLGLGGGGVRCQRRLGAAVLLKYLAVLAPRVDVSRTRIGGMLRRLTAWVRRRRVAPPDDLDTREELEAREEGRRLLEDKDTYRALGHSGPDMTSGARRDTGRR
jgi:hypothetical protein